MIAAYRKAQAIAASCNLHKLPRFLIDFPATLSVPWRRIGRSGGDSSVPALPQKPALLQASASALRAGDGSAHGAARPTRSFRSGQVVRILGITRRQLQYWAATALVAPSTRTEGGHHRYTFEDLVALRAAKQLIDAGVSVQRIRRSIGALQRVLPSVSRPLSELVLVATGDVVLVLRDGSAFEAVSGQEWVLEVSRLEREVHERLATGSEARRRTARTRSPAREARSGP
jgi:DNA-binding transcriptional MerR regulator